MKPYFYLLSVLYLATLFNSGWALFLAPAAPFVIKALLDPVVLGLCLRGAYFQAFGQRRGTASGWRRLYQATLFLGAVAVFLTLSGQSLGFPMLPGLGPLHAIMLFLPYLLFAIPLIVYEKDFKERA